MSLELLFPLRLFRGPLATVVACGMLSLPLATAADELSIVFTINGVSRSIPINNLSLQGGNYTVKTPGEGLPTRPLPESTASHVSGQEPPQIAEAVGLLLMNKPADSLTLLSPILEEHKISAKVPGNHWLTAARAALVAYSINRSTANAADIGKAISDATPAAGDDPSVALSTAMMTPLSVKIDDRIAALAELSNDGSPADVSAYACFFRGNLLKTAKRNKEALEAYLTIPAVYPTCSRVVTAAAHMNAAELLANMGRREEALFYLEDAVREGKGTAVGAEAERRIPLVK